MHPPPGLLCQGTQAQAQHRSPGTGLAALGNELLSVRYSADTFLKISGTSLVLGRDCPWYSSKLTKTQHSGKRAFATVSLVEPNSECGDEPRTSGNTQLFGK